VGDSLLLSAEEIREMGRAAVDWIAEYCASLGERAVVRPTTSARLRERLNETLPEFGSDFPSLLDRFGEQISEYSRHNGHPRFFGYVSSPGTPLTAIGSMLAAALNVNVTCWRSAPAATELEHVTVNWLKEMLGYPAEAGGLLVSGGSMANFAAMAAARSAKSPVNVVREGVAAAGGPLCGYVSTEGHFSISKAAGMLGLGERYVRQVRTNARLEIDMSDLERLVREDRAAGHLPFFVAGNAGTTATGAFDPIGELADFARANDLWFHVDAAYGGFAALAPSRRRLFERIGEADSVALDPHKWLYLSMGCGCVLYKDPAAAYAAFSHDAEYTRTIGLERDEAFAFWNYGPELSRPFRALDLWLLLKHVGSRRLGEAIEENIGCAEYLQELVAASDDFEMLAPVGLSVFCFRHRPRGYSGDLDVWNERVLTELQRRGSSYLSNARVDGKFALRGCVLNYRTTRRDMEVLLDDVRRAGEGW
jgi:glutamate/tyrosine decarboxylase-like PLP-dependent enzyme